MQPPTTLVMTWVERGKWLSTLSLPADRRKWDLDLSLAVDASVNQSGVYRRTGLILNSVRWGLLDADGFPVPFPVEVRLPKV